MASLHHVILLGQDSDLEVAFWKRQHGSTVNGWMELAERQGDSGGNTLTMESKVNRQQGKKRSFSELTIRRNRGDGHSFSKKEAWRPLPEDAWAIASFFYVRRLHGESGQESWAQPTEMTGAKTILEWQASLMLFRQEGQRPTLTLSRAWGKCMTVMPSLMWGYYYY